MQESCRCPGLVYLLAWGKRQLCRAGSGNHSSPSPNYNMRMTYAPNESRYDRSDAWFRRCGRSGLFLPAISLGCWHNFGDAGTDARRLPETDFHKNVQRMLFTAFDHGVTHFDLANNYGPAPGSAETRVGRVLREDFAGYRDELIISTKAGHRMWPGPYGEWGSRKYLLASLDQSLKRLELDYVDIFYSHRPDPETPLEETLGALDHAVRSGKAIYVGISSYSAAMTRQIMAICERDSLVQPVIHQPSYNMFNRRIEDGLTSACKEWGLGMIAFCPLAQGLLTDKYLDKVPQDSRFRDPQHDASKDPLSAEQREKLQQLNQIAQKSGQSLAQLALRWVLRLPQMTSALIGASRPEQVAENCKLLDKGPLSDEEVAGIEVVLKK